MKQGRVLSLALQGENIPGAMRFRHVARLPFASGGRFG